LPLFRSLADRSGEAGVLLDLGTVAWSEGSFHTAMGLSEEALAIYRDAGNRYEIAHTLHRLGNILRDSGDFERGTATLEEALAIVDELGDRFRFALIAHSLGDLALDQSDHERARRRYHEALSAAVDVGDESLPHYCLAGQACIAALQGDARNAGRLWAAAEAIEDRVGARMVAPVRKRYERILAPLSEDQLFQQGQEAGRDVPLDKVVRELMSAAPRGDRPPSEGDLVSSA
jgi:tetratricopeptide (TPR) repeat protein